jgi:S1-C subfamily serine protease
MTIKLKQEDFRRLVEILQAHPDFKSARDRRKLVEGALEGSSRADSILAGLDLEGAPRVAAVEVVKTLADFGQVAYGKEALGIFLNYLQGIAGDEQADFLADVFAAYPLNDVAAIRQQPIGHWRGTESPQDVREKIVGENTLRDVSVLELALDAAQAVIRVGLPGGAGSGFMIASDLVMTNNHVIATSEDAARAEFTFNYQLDRAGKVRDPVTVDALSDGIFCTSSLLDYTVVQVREPPNFGAPLKLRPALVRRDERVSIIQHPGGHFKKISMQNNFVAYADRQMVQYTTSTLPGSSGAPVFDDDFQVVGIHREGGVLQEPGSGQRYLRNGGTSMIAILADLKANAPAIYARIKQ